MPGLYDCLSGAVRSVLPGALGLVLAGPVQAGVGAAATVDLSEVGLETLLDLDVQTASRFSQPRSEAPASVSIVTADDIRAYGFATLSQILDSMRGIYIFSDRLYDFIGTRGFGRPGDYNSRVLLLIDGIRMNESVFGQGSVGTEFPLDVGLIERVEFVAGPGSAVYGNNAMLGVINVITRNGRALGGGELAASAGSEHTSSGRASFGRRYANGLDVVLSASSFGSRGETFRHSALEAMGLPGGTASGADLNRSESAFARLAFEGASLELGYGTRKKGSPNALSGTIPGDHRTTIRDSQGFAALGYERELMPSLDITLRGTFGAYGYDAVLPYSLDDGEVINIDRARSQWWTGEARLVWRGWQGHRILLGAEHQRNERADQWNGDQGSGIVYLDSRTSASSWGVYVQDEITLSRKTSFNVGARYDHDAYFGGTINPRAALIHRLDSGETLKLLYGSAFRAPNAWERFYSYPEVNKSNPDLRPERIRTIEASVERMVGERLRLTASAYAFRMSNLIGEVADPVDGLAQFRNVSRVHSHGLEVEVERLFDHGARLRANYAIQQSRDVDLGEGLSNSPRHVAKLNAITPLPLPGLRAGAELHFVSSRKSGNATAPSYLLGNLNVLWSPHGTGFEVSVGVHNLFDRRYSSPTSQEFSSIGFVTMPEPGRSLRARVQWSF